MKASFQSCLSFGKKYEDELLNHIDYVSYTKSEGMCKECDLTIVNLFAETVKFESKACRRAFETGNIIIEFESRLSRSGIDATDSDYFAYFVIIKDSPNMEKCIYKLFLIPTPRIRQLIKEQRYTRIVKCGDYNANKGYLFPLSAVQEYLWLTKDNDGYHHEGC